MMCNIKESQLQVRTAKFGQHYTSVNVRADYNKLH